MENRTDLALESYENINKTEIDGAKVEIDKDITTVTIFNENGSRELGKPIGTYITYSMPTLLSDSDIFNGIINEMSNILSNLLPSNINSVLVAGIGNLDITADALGPRSNDYVLATRHLKDNETFKDFFNVSSVSTGVLGDTGIESAEIIKGVVNTTKPECVIVIDALAASSKDRLGNTVQLSNTGISPGSGVGNHRYEISKNTLGVPVISIGIPTVLSTAILNDSDNQPLFVTPREIDKIIEQGSRLIGMAINVTFQKCLSITDILSLVG